ncbi:MAG: tetratricopeptide repeat protein [Candidatus Omnitrophica bacterium]|nr:tetratricopeptide repeat protein [Candidatus Omnitrophota bacterium]MDD5310464.1 tetratricopeptide repeat protein [Candidatus Omnitrophota bacterium]MDD5546692.1 tetratricopeptide repeat protein [Candidatus Omnitrophota bacterium]
MTAKKFGLLFKLLFACFLFRCALSFAQDEIILKNGNVIRGSILKTDRSGLSIEVSGQKAVIIVPLTNIDRFTIEAPDFFRTAQDYYLAKKYEQAYPLYLNTIQKYGGLSWGEEAYFKAADCQVKMGDGPKAIELYNSYIGDYPDAKSVNKARMNLAALLSGKGDHDNAIKIYDAVIRSKDESNRPDAYYGSAESYFAQGAYEQALVNYLRVEVLYYDRSDLVANAKFKSGECYEKLGEDEKALVTYREIIAGFPKSDFAKKSKAKLEKLEKGRKKDAT